MRIFSVCCRHLPYYLICLKTQADLPMPEALSNTITPHAITAMMRIRNESEFLESAVRSIVDVVDRILLVDNLSNDATPSIIKKLVAEYPHKIKDVQYPHEVARVGADNRNLKLAAQPNGTPCLLSNYYNWCLAHCHTEFVLKWDGDMIALPNLTEQISAWRTSGKPILVMNGANVQSGRRHLIQERSKDRAALEQALDSPGIPSWATALSYDHMEPRLFPLEGASYDSSLGWVERLSSPFWAREMKEAYRFIATGPCFLHMKFCKANPWSGYSPDLAKVLADNVTLGPVMADDWVKVLQQHGHA